MENKDVYLRNELHSRYLHLENRLERMQFEPNGEQCQAVSSMLALVEQERLEVARADICGISMSPGAAKSFETPAENKTVNTSTNKKSQEPTHTGNPNNQIISTQMPDSPQYIWEQWMPSPYKERDRNNRENYWQAMEYIKQNQAVLHQQPEGRNYLKYTGAIPKGTKDRSLANVFNVPTNTRHNERPKDFPDRFTSTVTNEQSMIQPEMLQNQPASTTQQQNGDRFDNTRPNTRNRPLRPNTFNRVEERLPEYIQNENPRNDYSSDESETNVRDPQQRRRERQYDNNNQGNQNQRRRNSPELDIREEEYRRNYRKQVPMHQWRVNFSGEGSARKLGEFLDRVQALQRAEKVSNQDLLDGVIHFLSGRAEDWYYTTGQYIEQWGEFVIALKNEFLPVNHDYALLYDIENRFQHKDESLLNYIAELLSMFRNVTQRISERRKLHIIQQNMLPRYAVSIAPFGVKTIQELSELCKRLDGIQIRENRNRYVPNIPPLHTDNSRGPKRSPEIRRHVNLVEATEQEVVEVDTAEFEQFLEWRKSRVCTDEANLELDENFGIVRTNPFSKKSDTTTEPQVRPYEPVCWNCRETGHTFVNCRKEKRSVFCYKCGKQDFAVSNCPQCSGNAGANSQRSDMRPSS